MLVGPGHRLRTECPPQVAVDWHTPATPLDEHVPHDEDDGRVGETVETGAARPGKQH